MKIVIGITQEYENIAECFSIHQGKPETLTEVGPFVSKAEALNWLVYLRSRIGDIEEIIPEIRSGEDVVWYGFTFEQAQLLS